MNICYWNIHKNDNVQSRSFDNCLLNLLQSRSIDMLCVSEFDKFDDSILLKNNYKLVDEANCDKVKCYKKNGLNLIQNRIGDRYAFIEYKERNILFVCVHMWDSMNYDEDKRIAEMIEIKREIDDYIKSKGQTKIFLLGDFNCMPYSKSITSSDILNCVLFRSLLKTRKNAKERYYNPMLLKLSERGKIYGSYYSSGTRCNLKWYVLDQVIVNKNSDKIIRYKTIELIKKVKNINLMKNNKPNSDLYSDHLPLYFEIKED